MKSSTFLLAIFLLISAAAGYGKTTVCLLTPQLNTNPASLLFEENITVEFNYETDEPDGVRIFVRPMTNGFLTPGYSGSPSPVYTGQGSGSAYFTIGGTTPRIVNEIRVQAYSADQSELLLEFYQRVEYHYSANAVTDIVFPDGFSGSYVHGENFEIQFTYKISNPGGARIFFRPISNSGSLDYGASGSILFSGVGTGVAHFTINSGIDKTVDAIRMQVKNADQSVLLDEIIIPVYLKFSNTAIKNIAAPGSIYFSHNQDVPFSFNYVSAQAGGVRIFFRPLSDGNATPNYAGSGSLLYPQGSGDGTASYTVTDGNAIVDQTRIRVYNADQSQLLLEYLIPADYVTGSFDFYNLYSCPPTPARLANNEKVYLEFNYYNYYDEDMLLFVLPYTEGAPSDHYGVSGSPHYLANTGGAGNAFLTITTGNVHVDAIRIKVTNVAQTSTVMEFYVPVDFQFGAFISPVEAVSAEIAEITLFPNPTSNASTLRFQVNTTQMLQIGVYDLTGRCLLQQSDIRALQGQEQTIQLEPGLLPNGMYLVQIRGENFISSEKWLLNR